MSHPIYEPRHHRLCDRWFVYDHIQEKALDGFYFPSADEAKAACDNLNAMQDGALPPSGPKAKPKKAPPPMPLFDASDPEGVL